MISKYNKFSLEFIIFKNNNYKVYKQTETQHQDKTNYFIKLTTQQLN